MLFLVVLVTAYLALQELQDSQRLVADNFTKTSELSELSSDLNRQRSQMLMMMLSEDAKEQDLSTGTFARAPVTSISPFRM